MVENIYTEVTTAFIEWWIVRVRSMTKWNILQQF